MAVEQRCTYEHQVWRCPEEAYDGQELCLLHQPPREGEPDRTEALRSYLQRVEDDHFSGAIWGMHVVDAGPVVEAMAESDIEGNRTIFHGALVVRDLDTAYDLHLQQCRYRRGVHFENVSYGDHMEIGGQFDQDLKLKNVKVGGILSMSDAQFVGDSSNMHAEDLECESLMLQGARCRGRMTIRGLQAENLALFNRIHVEGCFSIKSSRLGNKAGFSSAIFENGCRFLDVELGASAYFTNARFDGFTRLSQLKLEGTTLRWGGAVLEGPALLHEWDLDDEARVDFKRCHFEDEAIFDSWSFRGNSDAPQRQVILSNLPIAAETRITIRGRPDEEGDLCRFSMRNVSLMYTDASRIRFTSVDWGMRPAWHSKSVEKLRSWIGQGNSHESKRIQRAMEEDFLIQKPGVPTWENDSGFVVDPAALADLYRGLRLAYEGSGSYSEAGMFHAREMEMRTIASRSRPNGELGPGGLDRMMAVIYRTLGQYGESYKRPLIWIGLAVLAAWSYALWFEDAAMRIATRTPGYSELIEAINVVMPFPVSGLVLFALGVFGVLNLGLLAVALRRKFMRH